MKKLLLLLCTLLGTASAWAASYSITYDTSNGTFYRNGSASTDWSSKWVSNEAGKPVVTITTSVNNMNGANGRIAPQTYTISVEDGYIVTGFSMNCPTFGGTITVTPNGESATEVATGGTISLTSSASSFVFAASASGARIQAASSDGGSFIITVEDDPSYVSWTPSISTDAFVTVGEKVESITPVTDASDNSKWYIITQVRDGESPMYNVGTGSTLKRTATSITPATISGTKATSSLQYLVRFIEVSSGLYKMQFANGDFITSSLTTSASQNAAGTYAFYNSNGGSGSYFGWNLNSNTGQKVDNNGAGNTLSFWGSGTVSGTSGNNVWYVYSTEVAVPSTTYTYQISDASGVVFTSESYSATAGDVISTLPSSLQLPYCSYVVTPTTIANGENTVPVTVTYSLPFTVSTSFDDATWYYATIRGSKYLRADDDAKDSSGRYATSSTNEKTDAYKWAFFGNPYTNIYVMNKNQGGTKYLYKETQLVFKTLENPAADNNALFAVSPNSNGGFSLRNIAGGTNWYVNDAGGGGNLGFWNNASGANDNGSNWVVTEVPTSTIDVTYNLVVGSSVVNTVVDEQVAPNSEISVPASLLAGYSNLAWTFVPSGEIADENTTITVTATMKSGVVTALSQLSNSKAYTLNTVRGSLGTNGTQMVSSNGTSYTASNFAIINYEDNFYLYSVADSKFVANTTQPALTEDLSTIAALVFDDANATATSPLFFMGMGTNGVNVSNYSTGIVVNDWTTRDDGNQYCIIEAADFDATNALAALEEYFHPAAEAQFNDAIAALQAINFGNGLGQYGLTGEYAVYTTLANDIVDGLEAQGYTAENLAMAQAMLANYALNMPTAGFYRIKGKTSGKYLAAGMASNNKFNMTDAEDLTTIFYFDGTKLVNASSGLYDGMTASAWAWVASDAASTVEFQDGLTNGGYGIKSATCNFYDNGDNTSSADRGNSVTITTSTNARYTSWALEEASAFTLNLNDAGDGKYYATLCVPFDAILNGATAYTMAVDGSYLVPTEVATIAAGTPVLVKSENIGAVVTLSDNYAAAPSTETALTGTYVEKTIDGTTDYVLGKNADAVGFYHWDSNTLAANRAYVAAETGYSVKGFAINWAGDADGIKAIENANNNDVIYNLAGQRVTKAVRGIYVKNGKKVVVK